MSLDLTDEELSILIYLAERGAKEFNNEKAARELISKIDDYLWERGWVTISRTSEE